jgi:transposase
MNDKLRDPSVTAVGPVGSEGGRSPSTLSIGSVVPAGGLAAGQRWSVGRKREVVLRLLRGESAESLSRELGVPTYRLERWRERALSGIDGSLREREGDAVSEDLAAAMKRIGELTMENEVLRARVGHVGPWPGGGRGNGRRDLAWRQSSLRGCPCV